MKQIYVIEMAHEFTTSSQLNWNVIFAVKTLEDAKNEVLISRQNEEAEREKRRKKYGKVIYNTYFRYRPINLY